MTTKILIYYFLVERAYIVRGSLKARRHTKLWLFNCVFMMLPYTIFVIMNFVWRITYIDDKGMCIIGMQKIAMLPLITFEVVVNIYLTLLFIVPVRKLYSYRNNTNPKLNRMAFRSLIGSLATLTTSVANLTVLMVLKGEPGWICLMCCNADILFCAVVLHWVTSKDKPSSYASSRSRSRNLTLDGSPSTGAQRNSLVPAPEKSTSDVKEDALELCAEHPPDLSIWPYDTEPATPVPARLPGCVTTEIRSAAAPARDKSRNGRVLVKREEGGAEEVELHKIHVQREVCIDSGSSEDGETGYGRTVRNPSLEDAWGIKRSVSAEKMV
ncbi:hypothetical protein C7974DRAFT_307105 [Boeremia exigua]|uniref:uncharacterized protein n=1 Tax=Boeremia exigua TaxID=749465 RepID=UPI001E8CC1CB|nr:uncharacterized protein C7974DRAFT_307105 [Boeremia exigua]KAH6637735.1 hypothetical protein C7974DRAFT_307105 [Boeremia exigua]